MSSFATLVIVFQREITKPQQQNNLNLNQLIKPDEINKIQSINKHKRINTNQRNRMRVEISQLTNQKLQFADETKEISSPQTWRLSLGFFSSNQNDNNNNDDDDNNMKIVF